MPSGARTATFFSGKPCKRGHMGARLVSTRACCQCASEANARRYAENGEAIRSQVYAYRAANPEKATACQREWRLANVDRCRERDKRRSLENRATDVARLNAWNKANPERGRARAAAWAAANPAKVAARSARYRAALLQRTPPWADHDAINGMYELCAAFRKCGLDIEVDHEVPLQGKRVSGLHVADNLQLIHSFANKAKSNLYLT